MAFVGYVLTFNGSAQNLTTVLPAADQSRGGANDISCRAFIFQPDGANANQCYFHSANTVSASVWAFSLPASAAGVPVAPFILGEFADSGPLKPSDIWVFGTNNEKLHIGLVPY